MCINASFSQTRVYSSDNHLRQTILCVLIYVSMHTV